MKTLGKLEKNTGFWFVVIISFLFFILRLPSLFEPLWYGDEGIYQVIGSSLNNGQLLYKEIFDNKPPLLYWLYSFFRSDQFTIRLVSLIFGLLSIMIFFFLCKKLFKGQNKIPYITTAIFAILFGLPIFEGNIANAENFMILPIVVSSFFIVSKKRFFIAGIIVGLAFLFKIVAIFDFSAFLVFCLIINSNPLKKYVVLRYLIVGFSLPMVLVSLFFVMNNSFMEFVKAVFISNISYVSYGNKLGTFPVLLPIKLTLLGIFLLYIFTFRKKLNETMIFILIWFSFSLFNVFFSQRPYTHYVLVLIPSLSLMIGLLFDKKYQRIIVILLLISIIILAKYFGIPNFGKNIRYYQNFISYMNGEKTTTSYRAFFDRNTPVDYEIARFIKPKLEKNDKIFVWGNNAQLYQLTGVTPRTKYIVAYHITNYKDGIPITKVTLEKVKPKFIVIMSNRPIPFSLSEYFNKIQIEDVSIYERIL